MSEANQLRAALEDTQSALAASLARIEAFRIRERQLIDELAQLRQQVHGEQINQTRAAVQAVADGAPAPTATTSSGVVLIPARAPSKDLKAMSTCSITIPQTKEATFTSLGNNEAMYISSVSGAEHAAAVWLQGDRGLEKINCQLIVHKDRIDFVQLRVRIRSEDFIGITAVKESKMAKSGGGLLCCFGAPPPADPPPVPSSAGGAQGASTDQLSQLSQPDAERGNQGEAQGSSPPPSATRGRYRIYLRGREQRPVEFDASQVTRATLHKHTQRWLGQEDETIEDALQEAVANNTDEMVAPRPLVPGLHTMRMVGDPSHIVTPEHVSALASGVPPLERMRDWGLAYSTKVHGISLATLYRKVQAGHTPTITLIKDNAGHVFGCYTPEGWRIAPRYYGTGETFVFQLEPYRVMWSWQSMSKDKNDFFQYSTPECLALGGTGHFALHVDQELLQGSSGVCGTFGSPCLSGREDFKVVCMEVWQALS